jgi:hypothetical protein
MNLAIFGGFSTPPFPSGWTKQTAVALLGGGELDLGASSPAPGAALTAVAVLGGIEIRVPPGTRVSMSGVSILGGREVKVTPGNGPELRVRAVAILGGVEVKESVDQSS